MAEQKHGFVFSRLIKSSHHHELLELRVSSHFHLFYIWVNRKMSIRSLHTINREQTGEKQLMKNGHHLKPPFSKRWGESEQDKKKEEDETGFRLLRFHRGTVRSSCHQCAQRVLEWCNIQIQVRLTNSRDTDVSRTMNFSHFPQNNFESSWNVYKMRFLLEARMNVGRQMKWNEEMNKRNIPSGFAVLSIHAHWRLCLACVFSTFGGTRGSIKRSSLNHCC